MERFTLSNGVTAVKGIDENGQVRILEERDGKYFELSPSEFEEAKLKSSSVIDSIKEGVKQSYNEHMASANKLINQVDKNAQKQAMLNPRIKQIYQDTHGDNWEQVLNLSNEKRDKEAQANIDRYNEQAKIHRDNISAHGHDIIGAIANTLASPSTFVPFGVGGKGATALGKAIIGSGALAGADQLARDYGNTYKTEEEKKQDLINSALFGGLGGGALYGVLRGLSKGKDIWKNRKANKTTEVQEDVIPNADEAVISESIETPQPQPKTLDDYITPNQSDDDMADNIRKYLSDDTTPNTPKDEGWGNQYIDEVNTEQQIDDTINNAWANDTALKNERANLLNTLNREVRAKRQAELEEVFANNNNKLDDNIDTQLKKYEDEFNERIKNTKGYHYKIKDQVKNNKIKNPKAEELKNKIQSEMTTEPYIEYNGTRYNIFTREPINETAEDVTLLSKQADVTDEITEPLVTSNSIADNMLSQSDEVVAPVETNLNPVDELSEPITTNNITDDITDNINENITNSIDNNINDNINNSIDKPVTTQTPIYDENTLKEIGINNVFFDENGKGSIRFIGAQSRKTKNELNKLGFHYNPSTKTYDNMDTAKIEDYINSLTTKHENLKSSSFEEKLSATSNDFRMKLYKEFSNIKNLSNTDLDYLKGVISSIPQKKSIKVNNDEIEVITSNEETYRMYNDEYIHSIKKLSDGQSEIVLQDTARIDKLETIRDEIESKLKAKGLGNFEHGGVVYDDMGLPDEWQTAKLIAKENGVKNVDNLINRYDNDELELKEFLEVEKYFELAKERIRLNDATVKTLKDTENNIDETFKYFTDKGGNATARGLVGGFSGIGYEAYSANEEDREFSFSNAFTNALIGFGGGVQGGGMIIKPVSNAVKKTGNKQFVKGIRSKLSDIYKSDIGNLLFNSRLSEKKDYLSMRDDWQKSQDKMDAKLSVIYKALTEHLSIQDKKDLHGLLVGEEIENASNIVVRLAKDFRTEINKLSNELVDLGILSKETNDEWSEIYLHRSYERTVDKSLKQLFNGAKSIHPIHQRGKKWIGSAEEYQQYLNNGDIGRLSEGKISAEALKNGKYEFRRDWTKEEREAMGEITDGSYTVVETLKHLYDMRNAGRLLKKIKEETNYASKDNMGDDIALSGKKWGALQGLYVPREIATDLKNQYNQIFGHEDTIKRLWSKYLSALKKAWVVYNPTSHLNNVMSNVAFMVTSGISPLKAFSETLKSVNTIRKISELTELKAKNIANKMTQEDTLRYNKLMNDNGVKWYLEAEDAGVFGGSKLQEMLTQRGIAKQEIKNPLRKGYNKVNETLEKMYQAEDDMGRLAFYKLLRNNGISSEEAVKGIRSIIPDYRRPMSWFFSKGRDTGLLPFISWTYHVFPTIMKQLYKPIAKPFSKTDYGKGIWKSQAVSSLVGIGGLFGLAQMLALGTGAPSLITGDEAPKNWDRRFMVKTGDNVYGVKYDRFSPHYDMLPQNLGSTAVNYITGGVPQKLLEPFINNNMYYGTPITYDKGGQGLMDRATHFARSALPIPKWTLNLAETAKTAVMPKENDPRKYYTDRNIWEHLAGLAGLNVRDYNQTRWENELRKRELREKKKNEDK